MTFFASVWPSAKFNTQGCWAVMYSHNHQTPQTVASWAKQTNSQRAKSRSTCRRKVRSARGKLQWAFCIKLSVSVCVFFRWFLQLTDRKSVLQQNASCLSLSLLQVSVHLCSLTKWAPSQNRPQPKLDVYVKAPMCIRTNCCFCYWGDVSDGRKKGDACFSHFTQDSCKNVSAPGEFTDQ